MRIIGSIAIADLQVLLRDAEDVIPYDRIAVDSLYIQQDFDLNSYRTIPPSRLCRATSLYTREARTSVNI